MPLSSTGGPTPLAPASSAGAKNAPQGPRDFRRAAVLTYYTAPYPSDSIDGIFEALLMLAADRLDANGAVMREQRSSRASRDEKGSWLGRAWKHVVKYASSNLAQMRQAAFLNAFSRQLELNPAEESSIVMVSCQGFIISYGKRHFGSLFATNCGLYFCSCEPEVAPAAAVAAASNESSNNSTGNGVEGDVEDIKERVLFTDVASLLPSISLEQKETAAPFIQGIPSGVVAPTALQVFTVQLSTVLQFVGLHEVAVKQPKKLAVEAERGGGDTVQDAPCTDVVQKREFNLICELPRHLDTLKFCALLWRLWALRLHQLGRPLENPAVQYAEPH
ncbi:hypothetical protein LSCM1_06423 [Leishmania martiniquensis]|uniref:GRAM domain-containing protein n=1 Tax=Leishmania martiniquensis TaxID=1580590 RepID=A0A836HEP5_9TRYP|nr:hypothetical protein LSCM1_06423 [Leishmania martiniquensis]